ncbi:MAG: T9SS type A sorting domain-containing protein, partial [Gemmatimonadaceae bacterium]|nr:T9SS type A sorting domain-containing protein [Chitinophagaceae bacterium]
NYNDVSALGAMATVQESSLLAVKFLSFEASASANFAMLQWSVADARDSQFYNIEKSEDGLIYQSIGSLPSRQTLTPTQKYSFKDPTIITRTVYYRISSVDKAGRINYSPVRTLQPAPGDLQILTYPNPATSVYYIRSTGGRLFTSEIFHSTGAVVFSSPFLTSNLSVPVSHLPCGTYVVRLNMQDGTIRTARFLKL